MPDNKIYPVSSKSAHLNTDAYHIMYRRSIEHPQEFWAEQAKQFIDWYKPWANVWQGDFKNLDVKWFSGAQLNACYNCVDRHLPECAQQTAIIWQGNDPAESLTITYAQLYEQVCRFANVLKKHQVQKGDRISIYMPMIPEAIIAMLACARIGAVHSVIFGGFSADAIKDRILDADCRVVITANESMRGNKTIPLKMNIDEALQDCPHVKTVIVVKRTPNDASWHDKRDYWYHEEMKTVNAECPCEMMEADDPLFILYTSGSTGKPKGILHTTGGYMVFVTITHRYVFDYQEGDVYWCTADIGWITGHSYVVYGPLSNGAISLIYEGMPSYPTPARYWEIIDKYKVNIFYTSPTAIRALRKEDSRWIEQSNRTSLRILGTVGEPINPDVWEWFYEKVGNENCPIVDTWWQTETGGILITPLPGATPLKPGSISWPFFGVKPAIVDEQGKEVKINTMGRLVIQQPWPGMLKTIYGNSERFFEAYFKQVPGSYLTGDNARCDEQGYYWVAGRNDDVLKISGHRIGTAEVENALLHDANVAEAAVVGVPHDIKGEAIYAFITLKPGVKSSDDLKENIIKTVRHVIGAIAAPDFIQWAPTLPKTRSGKIMRRLLRKIANNDLKELGDTTTLEDPKVVDDLIKGRIEINRL